jgi:hypothetical protein
VKVIGSASAHATEALRPAESGTVAVAVADKAALNP